MPELFSPKLCGSTLFMLLSEAKVKAGQGRSERMNGQSDPTNEPTMLGSFLSILYPSIDYNWSSSTLSSATTAYKKGQPNNSDWLDLKNKNHFKKAVEEYEKNPNACLKRAKSFFSSCITDDPYELNLLGRRLLTLVYLDNTIDDNELLQIKPNFATIKKKDISQKMPFMLEPLLLGLMYYVVKKEIKHTEGADAYNEWFSDPDPSNVCHFNSDFADKYFLDSTFDTLQIDDEILNDNEDDLDLSLKNEYLNSYDFTDYLNTLKINHSSIKTFLYKEGQRDFNDIYVNSDIRIKNIDKRDTITNPTAQKIRLKCSQYTIISGTGGLGKSMLMNNLLLKAIDSYSEDGLVPVFICLNEIKEGVAHIYDYIFETIKKDATYMTSDQYHTLLKNGSFLFLFDGLDEIEDSKRADFEKQINDLTRRYSSNCYIISSRDREDSTFHSLDKFIVAEILPFNKEQALEMVEKIDYDDDKLKEEFKKQLDEKLYVEHNDFASNPLLLTIMLLTFEDVGEIQKDSYKFYEDAYRALSRSHDSHKTGYYRQYYTNCSGDILEEYLVEFCFLSLMNGTRNFTLTEFEECFEETRNNINRQNDAFTCKEFIDDLLYCLCLLQNNNGSYSFVHQSFQEYFCAKRLAKTDPEYLEYFIPFFNDKDKISFEKYRVFKMIYEMEPNKIKKHVFIPFLKSILENGDSDEDKYLNYLNAIFECVAYSLDQETIMIPNTVFNFLYSFITSTANQLATPRYVVLNGEKYLYPEYVEADYGYKTIPDLDGEYDIVPWHLANVTDEKGNKVLAGYNIIVPVEEMIKDKNRYSALIDALSDDNCDLKEEYNSVKDYYNSLVSSVNKTAIDLKNLLTKKK